MTDQAFLISPGIIGIAGTRTPPRGSGAQGLFGAPRSQYPGDGRIAGIDPGLLTVDGQPAVRTIRLYDRGPADDMTALGTGTLVAEIQSNPDGTYEFPNLSRQRKFLVVGIDDDGEHNAAVADMIVPVPMS